MSYFLWKYTISSADSDWNGSPMPEDVKDKLSFTNTTDGHNKFWNIWKIGDKKLCTQWGAIGSTGTINEKSFLSTWKRDDNYATLISSKKKKGYIQLASEDKISEKKNPILMMANEPKLKKALEEKLLEKKIFPRIEAQSQTAVSWRLVVNEDVSAYFYFSDIPERIYLCKTGSIYPSYEYYICSASIKALLEGASYLNIDGLDIIREKDERVSVAVSLPKKITLAVEEWQFLLSWIEAKDKSILPETKKEKKKPEKKKPSHKFSLADILDIED